MQLPFPMWITHSHRHSCSSQEALYDMIKSEYQHVPDDIRNVLVDTRLFAFESI